MNQTTTYVYTDYLVLLTGVCGCTPEGRGRENGSNGQREQHIIRIINYCQCLSRISCAGFLGRAIVGAKRRTVGDEAGTGETCG